LKEYKKGRRKEMKKMRNDLCQDARIEQKSSSEHLINFG
jgi:hypothetical protein